jgi:hypothetical protein
MRKEFAANIMTFGPPDQQDRRKRMVELLRECPIPDDELLLNVGLFLTPQALSRVLFMDFLYRQIIDIQGVVMEFGCRWGQNMSLFTGLRGIYEPFNRLRKLIGFDTFAGFPSVAPQDGARMAEGGYTTTPHYEVYLRQLLQYQEAESPLAHIRKFELVSGDATETVPDYLAKNPETIIALVYFDFDLYSPTKRCLEAIRGHLTRGSVIGFDELNDPATPGETVALKEVLGLDRYSIRRYQYNSRTSYLVVE